MIIPFIALLLPPVALRETKSISNTCISCKIVQECPGMFLIFYFKMCWLPCS